MAQCEKIVAGTRCEKPARPNEKFCADHKLRIQFTSVAEAPAPPPPPKPAPPPPPVSRAVPLAAGRPPAFPGLRLDERKVVVGPDGVVRLPPTANDTDGRRFDRLVKLLGLLSQTVDLAARARVAAHRTAGEQFVFLTPPDRTAANLSAFYDTAADAAERAGGTLYVGRGRGFVPYRDTRAARGYDAPDFTPPTDAKRLVLVGRRGPDEFAAADIPTKKLANLILRAAPVPGRAAPPARVFALAPPQLYALLARYFHAHRLRHAVARLRARGGGWVLFDLAPRADAGRAVPAFVLDYLTALPRVAVLTLAHDAGRRVLVPWRHTFPFNVENVAGAFADDETVVIRTGGEPALRVAPSPAFLDGDRLADVHVPQPVALTVESNAAVAALALPVELRPDDGPTPPVAALVLTGRELGWLRRLLYRLPAEAFAAYSVCGGPDRAVLLGGDRAVVGIPFGQPLRRLGDTPVFLPLRSRFVPDLPRDLLRDALKVPDGSYAFFTGTTRVDAAAAAFVPLSKAAVVDPARAPAAVKLEPRPAPPAPKWTPPPRPAVEVVRPGAPAEPPRGRRVVGPARPAATADVEAALRQAAAAAEQAGDPLTAALYYGALNDAAGRARCFRQAAAGAT